MFEFLKRSPLKRLQAEHSTLINKAFLAQRNGDIRQYSMLTAEAESLRKKIEDLESGTAA